MAKIVSSRINLLTSIQGNNHLVSLHFPHASLDVFCLQSKQLQHKPVNCLQGFQTKFILDKNLLIICSK